MKSHMYNHFMIY